MAHKNANLILQIYFIPDLVNIILRYRDQDFKCKARQCMKILVEELSMRSCQLDDGAIVFKTSYVKPFASTKFAVCHRKVFGRVTKSKITFDRKSFIQRNYVCLDYMLYLQNRRKNT